MTIRFNIVFLLAFVLVMSGCVDTRETIKEIKIANHNVKKSILSKKEVFEMNKLIRLKKNNENITFSNRDNFATKDTFLNNYTETEGVLTFRGNHSRTSPSYGYIKKANELEIVWEFQTSPGGKWGGGAGWTGQPSIIKWDPKIARIMNVQDHHKERLIEVIYASLDGRIYFLNLSDGKETREPIDINNPIKGSVSLDPRGFPLLYAGQGIPESGSIGYRIFSLIDQKRLSFVNGKDAFALRGWGAFDGAPLINKSTDMMYLGGENGLFYKVKLNTVFDIEKKAIHINPEIAKYRYQIEGNYNLGIENSIAVYKNIAYFADNGGSVQALDINSLEPFWALEKTDDTDATLTIDIEDGIPMLYTATEVDKQGKKGFAIIRKINGLNGSIEWVKNYPAYSIIGAHPINGGILSTPVVGKREIDDLVIFTISRYKTLNGGLMVALDKKTGEEVWRLEMDHYSWSSPVDVYTREDEAYLVQGDSVGNLFLIEGRTGEIVDTIQLGANIEASPAVYDSVIVVGTRGNKMFGIKIK